MKLERLYHFWVGLFAVLLFAVQMGSVAHATQYADAGHQHDGKVCVVTALSHSQVAPIPVEPVVGFTPYMADVVPVRPTVSFVYTIPPGRAPPPRSPPLTF